jgi:23S rRNA pseudouridine2457 synthase
MTNARAPRYRLLLLNKPYQVLCKFSDAQQRPTLADYVSVPDVYPAGRLDADSEGLVLLTDFGYLQHLISHPRVKLPKTYWVQVEGAPDAAALRRLAEGVDLKDGRSAPAQARLIDPPALWPRNPPIRERQTIPTTWLALTLSEGRNRQVRRMTAAVGYPTLRLVRVAIGPWTLRDLPPGQWVAAPCPQTEPEARSLLERGMQREERRDTQREERRDTQRSAEERREVMR